MVPYIQSFCYCSLLEREAEAAAASAASSAGQSQAAAPEQGSSAGAGAGAGEIAPPPAAGGEVTAPAPAEALTSRTAVGEGAAGPAAAVPAHVQAQARLAAVREAAGMVAEQMTAHNAEYQERRLLIRVAEAEAQEQRSRRPATSLCTSRAYNSVHASYVCHDDKMTQAQLPHMHKDPAGEHLGACVSTHGCNTPLEHCARHR